MFFYSFPEIQVCFEVTALSQEWPVVIIFGNKKLFFKNFQKTTFSQKTFTLSTCTVEAA
jgi:hypothetical protein